MQIWMQIIKTIKTEWFLHQNNIIIYDRIWKHLSYYHKFVSGIIQQCSLFLQQIIVEYIIQVNSSLARTDWLVWKGLASTIHLPAAE